MNQYTHLQRERERDNNIFKKELKANFGEVDCVTIKIRAKKLSGDQSLTRAF